MSIGAMLAADFVLFMAAAWAGLVLGSPALVLGTSATFAGICGYLLLAGPAAVLSLTAAALALSLAMAASCREDRRERAEIDAECARLQGLLDADEMGPRRVTDRAPESLDEP